MVQQRPEAFPCSLTDDLEVEWAGRPNWFFRIRKFSTALSASRVCAQDLVSRSRGGDAEGPRALRGQARCSPLPGLGVIINVTPRTWQLLPREERSQYILQERMNFEPVVETPFGGDQVEVRVMVHLAG